MKKCLSVSNTGQIRAFEDTWHWDETSARTYHELITNPDSPSHLVEMLSGFESFLGHNDMFAYLVMMAPRLVELHRVLKSTGSIYLHCDPTASHFLKILMDAAFKPVNFRNEIIWRCTGAHGPRRSFGPIHQTILFYSKSNEYYFRVIRRPYMRGHVESRYKLQENGRLKFITGGNILTGAGITRTGESGRPWRGFDPSSKGRHWAIPGDLAELMPPEFEDLSALEKLEALYQEGLIEIKPGAEWPHPVRYLRPQDGQPIADIWASQPYTAGTVYNSDEDIDADVQWLGPSDPERLSYPTQKPLGLLERIVKSSCPSDGIVLDPFCGCGTAIEAAEKLGRAWIGIDITYLAINLIKGRLSDAFEKVEFEERGEPKDLESAKALAGLDRFQFQLWALSLINAGPLNKATPRGADQGVDGVIYFIDDSGDGSDRTKRLIVQVKSGHVSSRDIRDLAGTMQSKHAVMGAFLTLEGATGPMRKAAASAGFHHSNTWERDYPRIQILTIEELLENPGAFQVPPSRIAYRRARKAIDVDIEQLNIGL